MPFLDFFDVLGALFLVVVVTLLFALESEVDVDVDGDGNDNGNGKSVFDFLTILESSMLFALSLILSQTEYDFLILLFALLFSFDKIIDPSDKKFAHSSSIHAIEVTLLVEVV
jgi:hypothetical protein